MGDRIDEMVQEAVALLEKLANPEDVLRERRRHGEIEPARVTLHVELGQFVAVGQSYAAPGGLRGSSYRNWTSSGATVEAAMQGLFEQLEKTLRVRSDRRRAEGEALLVESRGYDEA